MMYWTRSFLVIHQDQRVYQNPNEYMGMAGQRRRSQVIMLSRINVELRNENVDANLLFSCKERIQPHNGSCSNCCGLEHNVPDSPFASPKAAVDFFDDKLAIIG
ncbi:hypothetical protein ACSBR2_033606 [Camellia fascicularis]